MMKADAAGALLARVRQQAQSNKAPSAELQREVAQALPQLEARDKATLRSLFSEAGWQMLDLTGGAPANPAPPARSAEGLGWEAAGAPAAAVAEPAAPAAHPLTPVEVEAKLAAAEKAVAAGDAGQARGLAREAWRGVPRVFDAEAAFAAVARGEQGLSPEQTLERFKTEASAAFDADPIRNRGFRAAEIETLDDRAEAIIKRADVLDLEARIRAFAATVSTEEPYQAATSAAAFVVAAEREGASPESIASAKSAYAKAVEAYVEGKLGALTDATAVGRAQGLLAVGYSRMQRAGDALRVARPAADGTDPLNLAQTMAPQANAKSAAAAYVSMLSDKLDGAKEGWAALADKVDGLKSTDLGEAFRLVHDDVALGYDVLVMAHRHLGRSDELVPVAMRHAELELDVAERVTQKRSEKESEIGVVGRDAEAALRFVAQSVGAAPEDRARAAELMQRADQLLSEIVRLRPELPTE